MIDALPDITFNLLRPWWLLAILPALAFAWLLIKRHANSSGWASVIDSELLNELLDKQQTTHQYRPILFLLTAWISAALALAGPCFEKNEQAAMKQSDAVVILLDLSPSMLGQDIKPSRLQAAHYKILDLLRQRHEGYTALIAYSGSAHVVAPLSDDTNTIAAMVSTLNPRIMPVLGSRVEDAISEALTLLQNSHFNQGRLLLITDGVAPDAVENINQQLKGKSVALNIIGVGTADGAPIGLPNGNFVRDQSGNILLNSLYEPVLRKLAADNNGYYSVLRSDDQDITPLLSPPDWLSESSASNQRKANHTIENWQDSGYWFVLPCTLLALFFFRRGTLVLLIPLLLLTHQEDVRADGLSFPTSWQDWWKTPDQQAAQALHNGDAASAAKQFTDPQWKGYAEYQNGQHSEAAEQFAAGKNTPAIYNRGNAQARAGELQQALNSYEEALKQKPDMTDAAFNRDLVKKLLDKQQQKQQQDQKNQQPSDKQDQNQQKDQQKDQQQDQQQSGDQKQQPSDKQDNSQQDADQKNQQQADKNGQSDKKEQNNDQQKTDIDQQQNKSENEQNKEDEQKQDAQKSASDKNDAGADKPGQPLAQPPGQQDSKSPADLEKQQATEQWLRKVPDDPGGLLKNKFEYYYQLNRQQEAQKRRAGIGNEGEQRW